MDVDDALRERCELQLCQERYFVSEITRVWQTLQQHVSGAGGGGDGREAGPSTLGGEQEFLLRGGVSAEHVDALSKLYERLRLNSVQFSKGLLTKDAELVAQQGHPTPPDLLSKLKNSVRALRRINDLLLENAAAAALNACQRSASQRSRPTAQDHIQKRIRHLCTANLRCVAAIASTLTFGCSDDIDLLSVVATLHTKSDKVRLLKVEEKELSTRIRKVRKHPKQMETLLPLRKEKKGCVATAKAELRGARKTLTLAQETLGRLADTAADAENRFVATVEVVDSARRIRSLLHQPQDLIFDGRPLSMWNLEEMVSAATGALDLAASLANKLCSEDEKQRGTMSDQVVADIKTFVYKIVEDNLGLKAWLVTEDAISARIEKEVATLQL